MKYQTILIDPPWPITLSGKYRNPKNRRPDQLAYPTMTIDQLKALPVAELAGEACHLWLWTTNQFLRAGFDLMEAWGFKYLAPVHWVKPSGMGNYFVHRTQTLLFGYHGKCRFPQARYLPNIFEAPTPAKHSRKPEESYALIEAVSPEPRVELFSRPPIRSGWVSLGQEINGQDIQESIRHTLLGDEEV